MPKPRVVFDTNVFVRALINPQGINARLIQFSQQYALLTASRDPDNDKFLEAAIAGKADYLVTGDKDLRDIGEYEGAKIRFPEEFLAKLGA